MEWKLGFRILGRVGSLGLARGVSKSSRLKIHNLIIGIFRGVGGVGGLNAHNKDLVRPFSGSIVPYPPPPYPPKGPHELRVPSRKPGILMNYECPSAGIRNS